MPPEKLYRSKQIVAALVAEMPEEARASVGKGLEEAGLRTDIQLESRLSVQQRIIHLVKCGVVHPAKVEGSRYASTRWYTFDNVLEIALACDLQRFGYQHAQIKALLDDYRSEVEYRGPDLIEHMVITASPMMSMIYLPRPLSPNTREARLDAIYETAFGKCLASVVLNVAGWRELLRYRLAGE